MRVLIFPNDKSAIGNPYCDLLYSNMQKQGVVTKPFTISRALLGRWDIFHLHWPEYYLVTPPLKAIVGTVGLLACILWLRMRGTRIVWTAHNLHSHYLRYPRIERRFWTVFTPLLHGYIAMSEASCVQARTVFPALRFKAVAVIPHGDYRGTYPATATKADSRKKLGFSDSDNVVLYFGRISPYKNVPHLIDTFLQLNSRDAALIIAGDPATPDDEGKILASVRQDARVQLHLKRIPKEDVQTFFAAADLVALPFQEIMNSGSAILALSFDRPALVPDRGSLPELQRQVGTVWIRTFQGQLSADDLRSAIDWSANTARHGRPDLSAFAWPSIARDTISLYEKLSTARVSRDVTSSYPAGPV
jgi:glycosyltransferase involved in cell wall biosynthesis